MRTVLQDRPHRGSAMARPPTTNGVCVQLTLRKPPYKGSVSSDRRTQYEEWDENGREATGSELLKDKRHHNQQSVAGAPQPKEDHFTAMQAHIRRKDQAYAQTRCGAAEVAHI